MKSKRSSIHLIPSGEKTLAFNPDNFSALEMSSQLANIFSKLNAQSDIQKVAAELQLPEQLIHKSQKLFDSKLLTKQPASVEETENHHPTIYLNISNACNLRCVYCYANYGAYESSGKEYMKEATAFQTIDRFYELYPSIGRVVFFGGEPLLRAKLIRDVIYYIREKSTLKKWEMPQFSIITNGTLLTPENIGLIKEHGCTLTVSVDGPDFIHDQLRPTVKGGKSYEAVYQGLKRLAEVGVFPGIEVTYTSKHLEFGITPKAILEFMRREFSTPFVTLSPVAPTTGNPVKITAYYDRIIPLYREAARFSLSTLNSSQPILMSQVAYILKYASSGTKKKPNQFCYTQLGKEHFAISSEGGVYPCQMFNEKSDYHMGNVFDPELQNGQKYSNVQAKFTGLSKDNMQCKNCWARHMCFICIAGVEIETHALKPIPRHRCELIQAVMEETILHIYARR